jgi:hypothetical protein
MDTISHIAEALLGLAVLILAPLVLVAFWIRLTGAILW